MATPDTNNLLPFGVPYVRFAELLNWKAGFMWGPRRLYDHEFIYVLAGQLYVRLGDREFVALPEQVLLVPPQLQQTFSTGQQGERHDHIGIHFDWLPRPDSAEISFSHLTRYGNGPQTFPVQPSLIRETQAVPGWDIEATPVLDLHGRPRVRALFEEVVASLRSGGAYPEWRAGTLLAAAIAQLAHEAALLRDVAANPHLGADAVRRVQRARELLEEPRPRPYSIAEVAAQVGWTTDHLARMCREVLAVTPYRLQMAARMRLARVLLRQNGAAIGDVAQRCGFREATHFMSTFKKETGMTAREYMRNE